jgi:hypothetical protein
MPCLCWPQAPNGGGKPEIKHSCYGIALIRLILSSVSCELSFSFLLNPFVQLWDPLLGLRLEFGIIGISAT